MIAPLICALIAQTPTPDWREVREGWYELSATVPKLGTSPLDRLADREIRAAQAKAMRSMRADLKLETEKPRNPFFANWTTRLEHRSTGLISTSTGYSWYTGGAHSGYVIFTHNFAILNGKPQSFGIQEFAKPGGHARREIERMLLQHLDRKGASFVVDGMIKELDDAQMSKFVIRKDGVTWLFSPYDVASWAEGPQEVSLKWTDLRGLIRTAGPWSTLASPR